MGVISTAFELGHFVHFLDYEKKEILNATDSEHFNALAHSMEIKYPDFKKLRVIIVNN
ncbi:MULTISPECIES: hypothetical protein [unclassified Pseudoalteromonas]|uniref:hypothetical protein n=1 Tax=unclassified Pseudoalteromonas TaxID=194690 RepID=UPI001600314D|nr:MULTISPECIES: hypothetical protein [unclassified Pseudoalteromonas]MBB1335242.1 hypothetical protein [Pseudoalteromonas sp. SR41-6]MBB1343558.1 hypothetical protein [Pseudoalteromonas sp. SR45-6]MBB1460702.1 hypothetical protein [Pseudoalteromonas sp. SG41-8]